MITNFLYQNNVENKLTIEGDYAIVPFRILSEGLVSGHWIEFSKEVLQAGMHKFDNVTIFPDHNPNIKDWIGVVTNVRFTDSKGVWGIDADFKIDVVKNPEILRGLQMNPPAIKHCSVGIRIDYKLSHDFKSQREFERKLGQEIDGQIVRYIVTEILDVYEVSLVYKGADPHATRLSLPKEQKMKVKAETLYLLKETKSCFGEDVEMTPEEFHAIVKRFKEKIDEDSKTLRKIHLIVQGDKADITNEELVEHINEIVEEYREYKYKEVLELQEARDNAIKFYKLYADGKENPVILSILEFSNLEQANAMAKEYKELLEKKFPKNTNGVRASFQPDLNTAKINLEEYEV